MQNAGADETICYTIADSPLDRMLVARSAAGLCAVAFSEDDTDLVAELRNRYPEAAIRRTHAGMHGELAHLLLHLEEKLIPEPDPAAFPTDVAGTPFQRSVWSAMAAIPRGRTMEYGELAASLGTPQAQRAVGAAVGRNPLAVLIPCHRLVARSGSLHMFRWGLDRKRKLLDIERRQVGLEPLGALQTQGVLRFHQPEHD